MWSLLSRRARLRQWDLATPILSFSKHDHWTIGDACQGTQTFGSTGSGKSTGTMAAICESFLNAGFGGIFFTVKPDDRQTYEAYCRKTGRLHDLIVFGINEPWRYNPIDAELQRQDAGAGLTENIVALLSTLLEVCERSSGQDGRDDSGYWKRTNRQLMRNTIDLLAMATGRLSVEDLYRVVVSAAGSPEQVRSPEWRESSFCFQCLQQADCPANRDHKSHDLNIVVDFFLVEWPNLSEKTRSIVLSTFTSMLDVLNRGTIRQLMGGETNLTPEAALDGKIIILDLPIKQFGEVGTYVQILWKYCFQRAMERRNVRDNPRPVFLVCDESHLLAVSSDQMFQTTARSSRVATVYATQSISNYLSVFGDKAEAEVHSLLGNLQSQFFHQQADIKTNQYAAELIGRTRQFFSNASHSYQPTDFLDSLLGMSHPQSSAGVSESMEYEVQPSVFAGLRKGGPPHWSVDAILYQGGRRFHETGRPWRPVTFRQQF
ncbi:type IV secretory system conjugative DNA transfer family protein [Planctomicrobium sp. SH668]|uniref:type IV secretory system conjugative DNA transfer family protein n=1 Tax=Planctomicrobium sp. SH668 TaxID=3448126 RepID=UPI003F5C9689